MAVTYSAVQDGYDGVGNVAVNPVFNSETDLIIVPGSPCIELPPKVSTGS